MPVMVSFSNVNEAVFRLKADLNGMSERTMAGMRDGINELGKAVKYQAKDRGGLTRYTPPHPYGTKTPSPGDGEHPPAQVSQKLLNSVEVKSEPSRRLSAFYIRVGSDLSYAQVQEYGGWAQYGKRRVFLPPRPYMRPAYNRVMGGRSMMADTIISRNIGRRLTINYHPA